MDLTPHVEELRHQLLVAADAGGDDARELAARLTAPLDAALRLVLLDALTAAADEITREIAPGSVEVRLRGRDPELVVSPAPNDRLAGDTPSAGVPSAPPPPTTEPDQDEGGTARITLRLPEQLKQRIEDAAGRENLSVNSWLVRTLAASVDPNERRTTSRNPSGGQHYTGWAR
jgi:hypothetical protein